MQRKQASLSLPTKTRSALTIHFDGASPVCSAGILPYRRQPRAQVRACTDVASCAETDLWPGLNRATALSLFHTRRANGDLVQGIKGFAALWELFPRTASLGFIAWFGPASKLLEQAYNVFLAQRPLWRKAPAQGRQQG